LLDIACDEGFHSQRVGLKLYIDSSFAGELAIAVTGHKAEFDSLSLCYFVVFFTWFGGFSLYDYFK
jgi:hypothetical protein